MPRTSSSDPELARLRHDRVQQRNERLATLEREPLLPHVLCVKELLERLRPDHALEEPNTLVAGQGRVVAHGLHALLQPLPRGLVGDVHVLDAEGAAVRLAKRRHQLAQGDSPQSFEGAGIHHPVEIGLGEAEFLKLEQRMGTRISLERLEVGHQVSELAVGMDQVGGGRPAGGAAGSDWWATPFVTGEHEGPPLVDRTRIAAVVLIQGLDIVGACPGDRVEHIHRVVTGGLGHESSVCSLHGIFKDSRLGALGFAWPASRPDQRRRPPTVSTGQEAVRTEAAPGRTACQGGERFLRPRMPRKSDRLSVTYRASLPGSQV